MQNLLLSNCIKVVFRYVHVIFHLQVFLFSYCGISFTSVLVSS